MLFSLVCVCQDRTVSIASGLCQDLCVCYQPCAPRGYLRPLPSVWSVVSLDLQTPKNTPGLWAVSRHFIQFVASHVLESTCPDFHHFYCASLQPTDFLITVTPEVRRDICSWIIFLGDQPWELGELPNSHPDFSLGSEVHVAAGLHTPSFDLILSLPNLLQLTKHFNAWGWRFFQPVHCGKAGCCIHR